MIIELIKDLGQKPVGFQGRSARKGLYKCHCGKQFETRISDVKSGSTKSCGCFFENHGKTRTKEYRIWQGMKGRCYNPKVKIYEYYGGRGIKVCDRWMDSFNNFLADMGNCPDRFSLDRIDVNGNYEPENCRWSNDSEQHFNTRIRKDNKSGCPGVSFRPDVGKYTARIYKNGETIELGFFTELQNAIKARHEAEIKYFGRLKIESEALK